MVVMMEIKENDSLESPALEPIPHLEHGCNSWTIVRRSDGAVIMETTSRKIAESINRKSYDVLTTMQYLFRLNAEIRERNI